MFIIIVGNVVDGLTFYGAFETAELATDYADLQFRGDVWSIVSLTSPPLIVGE